MTGKAAEVKCPECSRVFGWPQSLGLHRLKAHGIAGSSPATLSNNRKKQRQETALALATPQRKPGRPRKTAVVIPDLISASHEEREREAARASDPNDFPPEILALAHGRFQGLCSRFAEEFDLPPRTFARRLAAPYIRHGSTATTWACRAFAPVVTPGRPARCGRGTDGDGWHFMR